MQKGPVLFDTNILIDLFSGRQEAQQVLEAYPPQNAISLVTWMEVMVGAKKYHQEYRTRPASPVEGVYSPSPGNRNGLMELRAKPSCSMRASSTSDARSSATASTFGSFS